MHRADRGGWFRLIGLQPLIKRAVRRVEHPSHAVRGQIQIQIKIKIQISTHKEIDNNKLGPGKLGPLKLLVWQIGPRQIGPWQIKNWNIFLISATRRRIMMIIDR